MVQCLFFREALYFLPWVISLSLFLNSLVNAETSVLFSDIYASGLAGNILKKVYPHHACMCMTLFLLLYFLNSNMTEPPLYVLAGALEEVDSEQITTGLFKLTIILIFIG